METQAVWAHIHAERRALAATLTDLTPEQWQADSLCAGWTVQDVAAHVISHPQIGWAQMPAMVARNFGRSYNAMIFREVKRMGASSTRESILADYATYDRSTRKVPTTTVLEPLMDCLVHHQDIVRPLGLRRDMHPEAAAVAADRARTLAFLSGSRKVVTSTRMVATDVDWVRGSGPTITGPIQELLMVCMGRARVATELKGDGLELLARA
ncbi:MAG: maleylpyruvate isomerase family mycothiol-dependent enzyme [Nocardioides sp.]|uniref:maleylpyruvate isomerase family mycothiol-dependent enzyme n=1 Tax=Nocardioides sp. TaxID=35761 RepID=UPI003267F7F6